jgi:hypothetical protein
MKIAALALATALTPANLPTLLMIAGGLLIAVIACGAIIALVLLAGARPARLTRRDGDARGGGGDA